jgi:transcriptional regulator with XRE-family HTH domain
MPDRTELGLLLQRMREERGESLTLMAARLEMTRAYLSAIELGKRRPPADLADKVSSLYELTHDERQDLYRACSRGDGDDVHRRVLTSMIVKALDEYDERFLLGLSMDLYPEEGDEGPTAVEVAVTGEGTHRDESNNCLVYLNFLEVEILEHALARDLADQRAYLSGPIPDDIDFEEWLELTDFSRSHYRRCEALFERVVGHPYDPADYDDEDDEPEGED